MAKEKTGAPETVGTPMQDHALDALFAPLKAPKEWAREKGTPGWHLAAAAAGEAWPKDKTLSESDFDTAIQRALSAKAG